MLEPPLESPGSTAEASLTNVQCWYATVIIKHRIRQRTMTSTRERVLERRRNLGITRKKTRGRPSSYTLQQRANRKTKEAYWAHIRKYGG